jgi:hypothetical protein
VAEEISKYTSKLNLEGVQEVRWDGGGIRILVGKTEGKRLLGKPRRRWVANIKMDLREIGWDGMD